MNSNDLSKSLFVVISLITTICLANAQSNQTTSNVNKTPVLFISTGTISNIMEANEYTKTLNTLGDSLAIPTAIVVISSHWTSDGCYITANNSEKIIYDFVGMPEAYYNIKYPVVGNVDLSQEIIGLITNQTFLSSIDRGIDSGAWTVVKQLFPNGNIPIIQISINQYIPPSLHFEIAKLLKPLRKKGVLFICSGNIVYNPRFMHKDREAAPFYWAKNFDNFVKEALTTNKTNDLLGFRKISADAKYAVPSSQQYIPLLYAIGLKETNEKVKFVYEGFENASISLRSFMIE
jgi:4,5-DOPA dioxygenase extradiol